MKKRKQNQQLDLFEPPRSAPTKPNKPRILGRTVNHTWDKKNDDE